MVHYFYISGRKKHRLRWVRQWGRPKLQFTQIRAWLLQNCQKDGCNQSVCANFSEQSYTSYRKKPNNFPKARQYGLKLAGETPIPQNCKIPWHTFVALCSLTTWIKALTPSGTPKRCTFSVIDLMFSSSLARSCWIFRSSFLLASPPPPTRDFQPSLFFCLPNGPNVQREGKWKHQVKELIRTHPKGPESKTILYLRCFQLFSKKRHQIPLLESRITQANLNRWVLIVSIHDWNKTFEYLNIPEATLLHLQWSNGHLLPCLVEMLLLPRNVFQFFPWVIDCWFRKFSKIRAVRDYFQQLPLSHPQDNISSVLTKNDLKPRGCKITSLAAFVSFESPHRFLNFRWLTNHDKKSCKLISLSFGPKFLVANSGWHLRIVRMLWMDVAPVVLWAVVFFSGVMQFYLFISLAFFFYLSIYLPISIWEWGQAAQAPKHRTVTRKCCKDFGQFDL